MPKRLIGPFSELSHYSNDTLEEGTYTDLLEAMDEVRQVLEDSGCSSGSNDTEARDPQWGADLSELICRSLPHPVNAIDKDGKPTVETIKVKLETLTVEVDNDGYVCAWIYEES